MTKNWYVIYSTNNRIPLLPIFHLANTNPMKKRILIFSQITSSYPKRHKKKNTILIIFLLKVSVISFPTKTDLCEGKE